MPIRIILAIFSLSGNIPDDSDKFVICIRIVDIWLKEILTIFVEILSKPGALPLRKDWIILSNSLSVVGLKMSRGVSTSVFKKAFKI